MKTTITTLFLILSFNLSSFSQACEIPNASFESWIDITSDFEYYADLPEGTVLFPSDYIAFFRLFLSSVIELFEVLVGEELIEAAQSAYGIYQSTDASDGEFAARIGGDETYPFADLIAVFECGTELPSSFSIDVKHVGPGPDTLSIVGAFQDNSFIDVEESGLTDATGYFVVEEMIFNSDTEYTTVNIPVIDNMNEMSPDSAFIVIFALGDEETLASGTDSYFLIDNMSFSLEGVLPLATTLFVGENHSNYNQVNWSIAYESNVSHYLIEKSLDDMESWTEVHHNEVNVDGTLDYQYKDYDLDKIGNYFYRLRKVDLNGNESLSEVIVVDVQIINKLSIKTYPNPITERFTVDLNINREVLNFSFTLVSTDGKPYQLNTYDEKIFEAGNHQLVFETENIPEGIYNLVINSSFAQAKEKIVITK